MIPKNLKRSALVGAVRGYLLLAAIYAFEYSGISNDVYSRGGTLGLDWQKLHSLASAAEATLFLMQLAILAPLGCLLGALLGIVFDSTEQNTTDAKRSLRIPRKMFPFLFAWVFCAISNYLFVLFVDEPFSTQRWESVMFAERSTMINDLVSHHKLTGLTVREAQKLLGPPNEYADPWITKSKHPNDPCLAYDLGHRTFKFGECLALYYGKDQTIQDWEITKYKFW